MKKRTEKEERKKMTHKIGSKYISSIFHFGCYVKYCINAVVAVVAEVAKIVQTKNGSESNVMKHTSGNVIHFRKQKLH